MIKYVKHTLTQIKTCVHTAQHSTALTTLLLFSGNTNRLINSINIDRTNRHVLGLTILILHDDFCILKGEQIILLSIWKKFRRKDYNYGNGI